jgi:hypothetical protein
MRNLFFALLFCVPTAAFASLNETEVRELNALEKKQKNYEEKLSSEYPIVAALAAAIAYKNDKKYQARLFDAFAVNDFSKQAKGEMTTVETSKVADQVQAMEKANAGLKNKSLHLLATFFFYRDRNEWMLKGKDKISVARYFRGAFLSAYYRGTQMNTMKLADDMDAAAKKKSGF